MLEVLIFDLGNVLAFHDNEKLFEAMAVAFGSTRAAMRERLDKGLWQAVNTGRLPGDALRQALNERLGAQVPESEWLQLWSCHFTLNQPMVDFVSQQVGHIKLVLLSNTHDQHIDFLRPRLPVLNDFDGLVLSYEVGTVKPDAAIYRRALEVARVPASRAVFFDDVADYAQAASQVGIAGRVFTSVEQCRVDLIRLGYQPNENASRARIRQG
jgi:glucose-1-phosphatase